MTDVVRMLAVVAVAICLVPAGAHLAEMPHKLALSPADYMIVQRIYAGWAFFGIAIVAALVLTLSLAVIEWRTRWARWLALGSFLCLAATQAIFWIYTYPMNRLTRNWTTAPPDIATARWQWEMSHAVNAGITLLALILIVAAVVTGGRGRAPSYR